MPIQSILPFFLILLVATLVAEWIGRKSNFYRDLYENTQQRYGVLDGLRGYLALSVFVHHAVIQFGYHHQLKWQEPDTHFYRMTGPVPVQVFFMITGFLFWKKAIDSGGKLNVLTLLRGRIFRIAPLYWFATLLVFLLVLVEHGFEVRNGLAEILIPIGEALTAGLIRIWDFNGIDTMPHSAGVTWTLVYEWGFYLLLPLLAWFAKAQRIIWVAFAYGFLAFWQPYPLGFNCLFFLLGMAAANLYSRIPVLPQSLKRALPFLAIVLMVCLFGIEHKPNFWIGVFVTFPIFLCFLYGADFGGLLKSRGTFVLGTSSYSIYLLHGPLLWASLFLINQLWPINLMDSTTYWFMVFGIVILVSLSCAATYRWIEHPMILKGRRSRKCS